MLFRSPSQCASKGSSPSFAADSQMKSVSSRLAKISPDTKVFSNLEPTMLYYDKSQSGVNMTIGKDAGYYHKNCPNVLWNGERQPYGYAGVRRLFEALAEV